MSTETSPELQTLRKTSIWKGAGAHRGEPKLDSASDDMMRFTATGCPYVPDNHYQSTWQGLANADFPQGVAGKGLPWKYTDDSIISIPCLRPSRPQDSALESAGEANEKKAKWWRRKSSTTSDRSMNDPNNFVLKKVQRRECLKHYAKDEQGSYIGTEEPAEDCILRGRDLERYRSSAGTQFRNDIAAQATDRSALLGMEETGDGVIQ